MIPYRPKTYTTEDAAHLLRRAGFGGSPAEIEKLRQLGPQAAAEHLLTFSDEEAEPNPHDYLTPWTAGQGDAASRELRAWWLHRMITTQHPLREKLTLFWHGHFPVSMFAVGSPPALYVNNEMLRVNCLKPFGELLLAVMQNPAFLIFLNADRSRKVAPNENLAREFFELFTIGPGQYTERDVRESARALAGWGIALDQSLSGRRFSLDDKERDWGSKTVLGKTGNLSGQDVITLAAEHPATALRITTKLWHHFVSETLPPAISAELAAEFKRSNGDLHEFLRVIFASAAFCAPENRHALIKSPAEYIVGAMRSVGLRPSAHGELDLLTPLTVMDQQLLYPNLQGWPGGNAWISTTTMVGRLQFANALVEGRYGAVEWPVAADVSTTVERVGQVFLGKAPVGHLKATLEQHARGREPSQVARELAHLVLLSPQYHLA